jgi:hypothetical protein
VAGRFLSRFARLPQQASCSSWHGTREYKAREVLPMSDLVGPDRSVARCLEFPGTDLTVFVELNGSELSLTVNKANRRVYRVVLEQATMPIENTWLADMFMRDDRVHLGKLSADVEEYVETLNIAQG